MTGRSTSASPADSVSVENGPAGEAPVVGFRPAASSVRGQTHVDTRDECLTCFRPESECFCALVPKLQPQTRVVLLQHPRERMVAIGTARMTHLALAGSELRSGVNFDDDETVQHAIAAPGTALLFPTDEPGCDAADWAAHPPRTLIVIDGTWHQARKVIAQNPTLLTLPRVGLRPREPGNYRIRKEPHADYLATVEAVSQTLACWEHDGERYEQMLRPFNFLVERQLQAVHDKNVSRHKDRTRSKTIRRRVPLPELDAIIEGKDAVVLFAEANRHPRADRPSGSPELVHLSARRLSLSAPAQHLSLFFAPRRPVGSHLADQLEVDATCLSTGLTVADGLAQLSTFFSKRDAVVCCWGPAARDLLTQEGFPMRGFVDVRALAARTLGRSARGIEGASLSFGIDDEVVAGLIAAESGRAVRRSAQVTAIVALLCQMRKDGVLRRHRASAAVGVD